MPHSAECCQAAERWQVEPFIEEAVEPRQTNALLKRAERAKSGWPDSTIGDELRCIVTKRHLALY